jgi:hypothetical protein
MQEILYLKITHARGWSKILNHCMKIWRSHSADTAAGYPLYTKELLKLVGRNSLCIIRTCL